MGYTAKLERGGMYILFDASGQYKLAPEFIPPTISLAPSMATGTSASAYADPQLVGERRQSQQISIPFHITGSSSAHVAQALSTVNLFLRGAGDENTPTYFSWRADSDVPYSPAWGQDNRRIKIASGSASFGSLYGAGTMATRAVPDCVLDLLAVGVEGTPQGLVMVAGGIIEHSAEYRDGISGGLSVATDTTNLITNPIFGNATYTTGWTVGSSLATTRNTDPNYVLFGNASCRISSTSTSNFAMTMSLTLANATVYCVSFYAKLATGGAVSATQIVAVHNNTAVSTTFRAFGDNGWYFCYGTVTGNGSPLATGVLVKDQYEVYVGGVQVELGATPTDLACGDFLGQSWTGTAHASTSTRPVGKAKLSAIDLPHNGTIEFKWMSNYASGATGAPASPIWWTVSDGSTTHLTCYHASGAYEVTDGTTTLSTAGTFTAGQTIIVHVTFGGNGLEMYLNGALIDSESTFDPWTTAASLYIGTDRSFASHAYGTFMDFAIYPQRLTAAQILARYSNLAYATKPLSPIPWLWTIDGDGVIDDITDADQAAYGVAGGIAGDVPTMPYMSITKTTDDDIYIGAYDADTFIPQGTLYSSKTTSIDNAVLDTTLSFSVDSALFKRVSGNKITLFTEFQDAGSGTVLLAASLNGISAQLQALRGVTADPPASGYYVYVFAGLSYPTNTVSQYDGSITSPYSIIIQSIRSVSGAANVVSTGVCFLGGLAYVKGLSGSSIIISNGAAYDTNAAYMQPRPLIGDQVYFIPNKINHVFAATTETSSQWYSATIALAKYIPQYQNA